MKTSYKYILMVWLALAGTSCSDLLEPNSETEILTSEAIVDRQSAVSAVNGLYSALQSQELYGSDFILANECAANNARDGAFQVFWAELASAVIPTSNSHLEFNWIDFYLAVNAANTVLSEVPKLEDVSDSEKAEFMGTAYFVRGMVFFDLLRRYGEFDESASAFGIPMPLDPPLSPVETARSTVAQSYAQIESDLTEAFELLQDHGNPYYASSMAAKALLARVYLHKKDWDNAFKYADEVIETGGYVLLADYNNVYRNEGSEEAIFELNFTLQDPSGWSEWLTVSPGEVLMDSSLYNSFENTDSRQALFGPINNTLRCLKYGSSPDQEDGNSILIRLAEMYLIRSEALANTDGANAGNDELNVIRTRAGLGEYDADAFASLDDYYDALLEERRHEFAFEGGHYWFDLARTGRVSEVRNVPEFRRIFPIPQREINITDDVLVQNPGYVN
jgi:hypothetical protein